MADFVPQKHEANEYNKGVQYVGYDASTGTDGDMVQATTINNLIESALYSQAQAESANALVDSVVTDAYAPPLVGMHHIQFNGEPTPAEIWGGTTWEIDTDYQGRTIIGSGGDYTFGSTGGEATHTLTINEMPQHEHTYTPGGNNEYNASIGNSGWLATATSSSTSSVGGSQPHNNMSPYIVVNYWKRTA